MLYLHVGLHKTGTTYFQQEVFPRWPGLTYLRAYAVENFLRVGATQTCLVSREGFSGPVVGHQTEKLEYLHRLSRMFPDGRVLISFRRHGSYLNAVYSQYLRYGGTLSLAEFFDIERDTGFMKRDDLRFRAYVEAIRDYWGRPPFVYLLPELKEDPARLMSDLGALFGCAPPPLDAIRKGRSNVSLGRPQAALLRRVNRWCGVQLHRDGSTRPYRLLRRLGMDPPELCQRWARLRPSAPIVPPELERQIDAYYRDDWAFVGRCAAARMDPAGLSSVMGAGGVRAAPSPASTAVSLEP